MHGHEFGICRIPSSLSIGNSSIRGETAVPFGGFVTAVPTAELNPRIKSIRSETAFHIGGHPTADSTAEFKRRFHSAARPPIRPPITNRGENQGDAKCISIGGLRAKPSTF
ncbi:hypothetical protein LWI29_015351 [Acer saccharum]|uniref:Uncharacterized protein n=1 Tax=Acer saccharum TaxID=4024 RepID=A0AA39VVJ9_ACESA|nr:hypothetical protein LWI29_030664 [Acer saccharum]KAK0594171.1 hypothetical protein LWI29_015351 [Acer saccharum]